MVADKFEPGEVFAEQAVSASARPLVAVPYIGEMVVDAEPPLPQPATRLHLVSLAGSIGVTPSAPTETNSYWKRYQIASPNR